jgi:hypothetical protein
VVIMMILLSFLLMGVSVEAVFLNFCSFQKQTIWARAENHSCHEIGQFGRLL